MKINNWPRKIAAALVAAGLWLPATAYAFDILLEDPSFENYVVPAVGYAYSNEYRPTSAWVDDLDSPAGYFEDDGSSHWLYNAAYAEDPTNSRRAAPRTGDQAMHGLANYSAQETIGVFEAGRTYRFSLWAQNDEVLDHTSGVFLYIFDAQEPFSEANALAATVVTEINDRLPGMTAAQSAANWTHISVSHTVAPDGPEIGHQVGVGFFARRDSAVDDATLTDVLYQADFDGDDDVDGNDYLLWQRGLELNALAHFPGGQGDGDPLVDGDDIILWAAQFGATPPTPAHQVPEPQSIVATSLAAAALGFRRRAPLNG
jgi:hypothetical protein